MRVTAYRIVKTLEPFPADDSDIITFATAAQLSGYTLSGVYRLVESGKLPELRMLARIEEGERYTFRPDVMKIKKPIGARRAAKADRKSK